jgi:hypothetical protein
MTRLLSVVLLVFVVGISAKAQTLTEQLQRGIYAEETLKNPDEAVRIYRQILAAPSVPQTIAAEAQRRLARLLLSSAPVALGVQVTPSPPTRSTVVDGRYRHLASGISFEPPAGWTASDAYPSSDNGEMMTLTEKATNRTINVWMIREDVPTEQLGERVAGRPAEKLRQRHTGYGIPGMQDPRTYDIPAETVQPMTINGRQAIIAIGQYQGVRPESLHRGPRPAVSNVEQMIEYMTWIDTEKTRAFFFARVPEPDLPLLRPLFDEFVRSARFP